MSIRTLIFPLTRDHANSQVIGYLATQQNAAYNHTVKILNHEPNLAKRSGKEHHDAINKRITAWRQKEERVTHAPYHIHQLGSEQAWDANQLLQQRRVERLERIAQAIAGNEEPKHRDTRPHRRTLKYRTRKTSQLTLSITDKRLFDVSDDGQTLTSHQCGFTLRVRAHRSLKWLDIRSIQLVAVKNYRATTPLKYRHYCLHVQVGVPEPKPLEELDTSRSAGPNSRAVD